MVAGNERHACIRHDRLGRGFGAHGLDRGSRGPDPDETVLGAQPGKVCIFRQEAVTRVHRLHLRRQPGFHDAVGAQVGFAGRRRPDADCLVGHRHVQCVPVGV